MALKYGLTLLLVVWFRLLKAFPYGQDKPRGEARPRTVTGMQLLPWFLLINLA